MRSNAFIAAAVSLMVLTDGLQSEEPIKLLSNFEQDLNSFVPPPPQPPLILPPSSAGRRRPRQLGRGPPRAVVAVRGAVRQGGLAPPPSERRPPRRRAAGALPRTAPGHRVEGSGERVTTRLCWMFETPRVGVSRQTKSRDSESLVRPDPTRLC